MRFLVVIILVLAIAGGVAWAAKRASTGEGLPESLTLADEEGDRRNGDTPTERRVEALDQKQDAVEKYNELQQERAIAPMEGEQKVLEQSQELMEKREELRTEQQTVPMEQEQKLLREQQELLEQQQALQQQQEAVPYEQEIERIRQQKRLIEEQRELEEMQREQNVVPSPIPKGIRPYPLGKN